jgi:hypothetical protein
MAQRNYLYRRKGKLLSLNKCFKTLIDNNHKLREAIKLGYNGIRKFEHWINKILIENHWLEKKKNSSGLEDLFLLNILQIK